MGMVVVFATYFANFITAFIIIVNTYFEYILINTNLKDYLEIKTYKF